MSRISGKRKLGLLAAVVCVLLIVVLSLQITEVTVTGNRQYTQEEMISLVFPDRLSRSTGLCYIRERMKKRRQIPFVEDYKIEFHGLNRAEIIVYEKSIVGYVSYMNSYLYFDKDGMVVESSGQKLPGVPMITGLKFGYLVLYQPLPVENQKIFDEILNLTQILSVYGLKVDRIHYSSYGEATLYMGDIEVILGNNDELNGKISELSSMMPRLEGLSGTLHLETYTDEEAMSGYEFEPRK